MLAIVFVVLPGGFLLFLRHAKAKAADYQPPAGTQRWG